MEILKYKYTNKEGQDYFVFKEEAKAAVSKNEMVTICFADSDWCFGLLHKSVNNINDFNYYCGMLEGMQLMYIVIDFLPEEDNNVTDNSNSSG